MNTYILFQVIIFVLKLTIAEGTDKVNDLELESVYLSSQYGTNLSQTSKYILASNESAFTDMFPNQQNQESKFSNRNLILLLPFSVVSVLSVVINIRVFYIVFVSSNRKSRPANIFVAHISSVVIGFTIVIYIYILEKTNLISLALPGICNVFAFLRNIIHNVFPVNAGAIIWVRTRPDAVNLRKSFAYRSIGMIWAITILGNLPSTFMVEYARNEDTKFDKCKEVPLFGSIGTTIAYESWRFVLFNILICLYLIRSTIKIRSSIRYLDVLKLVQSERLRKRIHQVRLVYLHTFAFILNWFPNGLVLYIYKIFTRLGLPTGQHVTLGTPIIILNYCAFVLCPLSYVFLLEDMSIRKFFALCYQDGMQNIPVYIENNEYVEPERYGCKVDPILKNKSSTKPKDRLATVSIKENHNEETYAIVQAFEMTRMTTVGVTGTSGILSFTGTTVKSVQNPVYTQSSSIPAVLTPTTAAKLQSITIQMQEESKTESSGENEIAFRRLFSETSV